MKFKFLPIIMFVASAHFYGQITPEQKKIRTITLFMHKTKQEPIY